MRVRLGPTILLSYGIRRAKAKTKGPWGRRSEQSSDVLYFEREKGEAGKTKS